MDSQTSLQSEQLLELPVSEALVVITQRVIHYISIVASWSELVLLFEDMTSLTFPNQEMVKRPETLGDVMRMLLIAARQLRVELEAVQDYSDALRKIETRNEDTQTE
jgi:hypothetical protein